MNIFKTTVACILICLCSCVETPASLKDETSKPVTQSSLPETIKQDNNTDFQPENVSQEPVTPIERGDLNTIRSQLSLDLQKTYKNIVVTRARVSKAEAMPVYDIKMGRNPDYDFNKLIECLYGDRFDCADGKNYVHNRKGELMDPDDDLPPHSIPTYYEKLGRYSRPNVYQIDIDGFAPYDDDGYYKNGDYTVSTYLYSIGNVWGSQSGGGGSENIQDWYYYESHTIYKSYDLFSEKPADDEAYIMADGQEWNANEAIKFVENFWAEYIVPSDPENFTYSVKTLYIIALDDDKYSYLFSMQRQDKNGNYFDVDLAEFYYMANANDGNAVSSGEPFIFTNNIMAYCAQKEVFNRFIKNFSFSYEQTQEQGNELLSLGAAADILSQSLAPNIGLTLTAELNYVVMCKGYPYFQEWEYAEFYDHYCLSNCDFEIRPVWCFRRPDQCYLMNSVDTERYFVDAVTGEVSTIVRYQYQKCVNVGKENR